MLERSGEEEAGGRAFQFDALQNTIWPFPAVAATVSTALTFHSGPPPPPHRARPAKWQVSGMTDGDR